MLARGRVTKLSVMTLVSDDSGQKDKYRRKCDITIKYNSIGTKSLLLTKGMNNRRTHAVSRDINNIDKDFPMEVSEETVEEWSLDARGFEFTLEGKKMTSKHTGTVSKNLT